MKTGGKIILIICVLVLFLLVSVTGVIVYYYTHPSALKALVEHAVSRSTGTTLTIKGLTYTMDPIRIAAKGIVIKPPEGFHGFSLDIPDFTADFSLEGPFGRRSLMVERLRMARFSCRISEDATIPRVDQEQGPSPFFNTIVKRLIAFFFFRDVQFQGAEVSDGSVIATLGEQTVRVKGLQARLNAEHLMALSCAVNIDWPRKKMKLNVPYLDLETDGSISFVRSTIGCLLSFRGATFSGPEMNMGRMTGEGKLHYQHGQGDLLIKDLRVVLGEVDLGAGPPGKMNTFGVNLETEGAIHTRDMKLMARRIRLQAGDMLRLEGTLDVALDGKRRVKGHLQLRLAERSRPFAEI